MQSSSTVLSLEVSFLHVTVARRLRRCLATSRIKFPGYYFIVFGSESIFGPGNYYFWLGINLPSNDIFFELFS